MDSDGARDVITGSFPGELYIFHGQEDGSFAPSEQITDNLDGEAINVGSASTVFATDWDDDGDLDLLIGTIRGYVWLVPNETPCKTRVGNQFGEAVQLSAAGSEIRVPGGDAGPVVADWDGDGANDLVVGCGDGSVVWFRNEGDNESPELAASVELVVAGSIRKDSESNDDQRGSRSKICVTDYNGDGALDLLLGDFQVESVELPALTEEQLAEKAEIDARWEELMQEQFSPLREKIRAATAAGEEDEVTKLQEQMLALQPEMRALQSSGNQFQTTQSVRHGFVWLLLREET